MTEFKKVVMTENKDGSPDGVSVRHYEEGGVYDLPSDLADMFLNDLDCAEEFDESFHGDSEDDSEDVKKNKKDKKGKK